MAGRRNFGENSESDYGAWQSVETASAGQAVKYTKQLLVQMQVKQRKEGKVW